MSCLVYRFVVLTFEDETRCAAFHKRIREMLVRHSSSQCTMGDTEKIELKRVGSDEVDWENTLGYVFKGRNEEERLVRIWTMGKDGGSVSLSFNDMINPDARTLQISGESACWGPELFSCFRQYMDGGFGLERVKIVLWSEYNRVEVWCQDSDGEYFYNVMDSDDFDSVRHDLAEEQEMDEDDELDLDDTEVLAATGVLNGGSEYEAHCDELDDLDLDGYPTFYDAGAADDGENAAAEDGEDAAADDGEDAAADDGENAAADDGEDAAAEDGEDAAAEDGEDAAAEDGEDDTSEPRHCEQCGATLADGMKFCSECGVRISRDKECPACHTRVPSDTKFCFECGHNFAQSAGAAAWRVSSFTRGGLHQTVECKVCGRQVVITEACRCLACFKYVCKEHFNGKTYKCHACDGGPSL